MCAAATRARRAQPWTQYDTAAAPASAHSSHAHAAQQPQADDAVCEACDAAARVSRTVGEKKSGDEEVGEAEHTQAGVASRAKAAQRPVVTASVAQWQCDRAYTLNFNCFVG